MTTRGGARQQKQQADDPQESEEDDVESPTSQKSDADDDRRRSATPPAENEDTEKKSKGESSDSEDATTESEGEVSEGEHTREEGSRQGSTLNSSGAKSPLGSSGAASPQTPDDPAVTNQASRSKAQSLQELATEPEARKDVQPRAGSMEQDQPISFRDRVYNYLRPLRYMRELDGTANPPNAEPPSNSQDANAESGESGKSLSEGKEVGDSSLPASKTSKGQSRSGPGGSDDDPDRTRAPSGDSDMSSKGNTPGDGSDNVFENGSALNSGVLGSFHDPSEGMFEKSFDDYTRSSRRDTIFKFTQMDAPHVERMHDSQVCSSSKSEPMINVRARTMGQATRRPSVHSELDAPRSAAFKISDNPIRSERPDGPIQHSPVISTPGDHHRSNASTHRSQRTDPRIPKTRSRDSKDGRSEGTNASSTSGELLYEEGPGDRESDRGIGRSFDDIHRHPPLPDRRHVQSRRDDHDEYDPDPEVEDVGMAKDTSWVTATGRLTRTPRTPNLQPMNRTNSRESVAPLAEWSNVSKRVNDCVAKTMLYRDKRLSMVDGHISKNVQSSYDRMRTACEEKLRPMNESLLSYEKRLGMCEQALLEQNQTTRSFVTKVVEGAQTAVGEMGKTTENFQNYLNANVQNGSEKILDTISKNRLSEKKFGRELESTHVTLKNLMEFSLLSQGENLTKVKDWTETQAHTNMSLQKQQREFDQKQLGLTTQLTHSIRKISRKVGEIPRRNTPSPTRGRTPCITSRDEIHGTNRERHVTFSPSTDQPSTSGTATQPGSGERFADEGERGSAGDVLREGEGTHRKKPLIQRNCLPAFLEKTLIPFDPADVRDFSDFYRYFSQMIDGSGGMLDDVKLYWLGNYLKGQARDAYELYKLEERSFKLSNVVKHLSRMFDQQPSTSTDSILNCVQKPNEDFRIYSVRLRNQVDRCHDERFNRPGARAAATLTQLKHGVLSRYVTGALINATTILQAIEAYETEKRVQDIRELKERRLEAKHAHGMVGQPLADGMRRRDRRRSRSREHFRRFDEKVAVNVVVGQGTPPKPQDSPVPREGIEPPKIGKDPKQPPNLEHWCEYHRTPGHKTSECFALKALGYFPQQPPPQIFPNPPTQQNFQNPPTQQNFQNPAPNKSFRNPQPRKISKINRPRKSFRNFQPRKISKINRPRKSFRNLQPRKIFKIHRPNQISKTLRPRKICKTAQSNQIIQTPKMSNHLEIPRLCKIHKIFSNAPIRKNGKNSPIRKIFGIPKTPTPSHLQLAQCPVVED